MIIKNKSILITGVAGFIGCHLARHYLDQNYHVIGIDNFSSGTKKNIEGLKNQFADQFIFFELNVISEWNFLVDLKLENLCYVFHLASIASVPHYQKQSLETLLANSVGLMNALKAADNLKARLIFSSTSEIYGDPTVHPQPESYFGNVNSFGPRACYDEGKRFGEALIYSHNERYKTRHGLVRIFNTYGPRMNPDDGRVLIHFISQALKGEPLTIHGDGQQTRSFCYIDDMINGLVKYANSDITTPINLGNDHEISILDIACFIKKTLKSNSEVIHLDHLKDDPRQRRPDLSLAQEKLSYAPQVSLEEGVLKMAEWVKSNN